MQTGQSTKECISAVSTPKMIRAEHSSVADFEHVPCEFTKSATLASMLSTMVADCTDRCQYINAGMVW